MQIQLLKKFTFLCGLFGLEKSPVQLALHGTRQNNATKFAELTGHKTFAGRAFLKLSEHSVEFGYVNREGHDALFCRKVMDFAVLEGCCNLLGVLLTNGF